jgi:hypothetical protein
MMAAAELLAECSRFGLTVQREGNKIALEAPAPPPPELLDRLRAAKPALLALLSDTAPGPDEIDFAERAAIIEFDGGIPREWADGFARLDCATPPAGIPAQRWRATIDAIGAFLDQWAAKASALGWEAADLFGADNVRPEVSWLNSGPLWIGDGARVIEIDGEKIVFQTRNGFTQTARRRPYLRPRVLPWELGK